MVKMILLTGQIALTN